MALLIQRNVLTEQTALTQSKKQTKRRINTVLTTCALLGMLSLSACQTAPTSVKTSPVQTSPSAKSQPTTTVTQAPIIKKSGHENEDVRDDSAENDYQYSIEAYDPPKPSASIDPLTKASPVFTSPSQSPIITQPDIIILTPSREDEIISQPSIPSHNELLDLARQNSQQRSQQTATNNSNLPAFRNLMQVGTGQLKAGNLNGAESSFTRAQRLAPKSSAVYFYLAQVALKKNQPRKAEAMARRGLSVSQDSSRRRALWQMILQSGQQQGNARVIKEARQALR